MSDYLLLLETRGDLTVYRLLQTTATSRIGTLSRILLKEDTVYDFQLRATALRKHWSGIESLVSKSTLEDMLLDHPVTPVKSELPNDKPVGWKPGLDETRADEAQRQFELLKIEKNHCRKYR
jgi:hypothetical protein